MSTDIDEAAAAWLIRFRAGPATRTDKREFDRWLRQSPQHIRAYLQMLSLWEDLASIQPPDPGRQPVHGLEFPSNVINIPTQVSNRSDRPPTLQMPHRNRHLAWGFAAAVLLICCVLRNDSTESTLISAAYDPTAIRLADGSVVNLNSGSQLRVRFTTTDRRVDLLRGQALFQVAGNAHRPFVVHTRTTSVRAVGTEFDVNTRNAATVVTVVEGRVAVASVILNAGQQAAVSNESISTPVSADVAATIAWSQRSSALNNITLAELATAYNRKHARQIVIPEEDVQRIRMSGIYSTEGPPVLLQFLRAQPDLTVDERDDEILILRNQ